MTPVVSGATLWEACVYGYAALLAVIGVLIARDEWRAWRRRVALGRERAVRVPSHLRLVRPPYDREREDAR